MVHLVPSHFVFGCLADEQRQGIRSDCKPFPFNADPVVLDSEGDGIVVFFKVNRDNAMSARFPDGVQGV